MKKRVILLHGYHLTATERKGLIALFNEQITSRNGNARYGAHIKNKWYWLELVGGNDYSADICWKDKNDYGKPIMQKSHSIVRFV